MKTKKILSIITMAALLLAMLGTVTPATAASYDKVVYAYATFNNIPSEDVLATVEEAINQITREKIGVEVELMPIMIWDYSSTVSLALQGGEQVDIFQTLGDLNTSISNGMSMDVTDLVAQYAPEAAELIGANWLAATSHNGRLYGLPTFKPIALTPMLVYRQDIADALGLDMSAVNSVADIGAVLEAVKAGYPDMTPLAAVNTGNIGLGLTVPDVDYLTDNYFSPKGVLMNDELTVVDFYASDAFTQLCNTAREWYLNDLVMKDAATTSSTAAELMSSGNYFAYLASYSYPEADTAASLEAQTGGYDLGAKIVSSAFLDTSSINALTWCVASTSKVPEAAVKFLNLTFTDPDVVNLIIYGLEGRDYVLSDGFMSYPEGQEASTVPYTAQLSCGTLGNFFIMYPMAGTDPESLAWELEQNQNAKTSVAMGFTFDSSSVKTEYTAVTNVIEQYLPGLICGSVDPATEIPVFLERLQEAGIGDIIAAKQAQLDAWVAANK
ncbi:MAG TPA: ABC transporter substrate-binding protein [Candidatus Limiplasma sp.]|nr:ABC transporter substrate-binding protein [Candidatus Limiplasma sp.]HRX08624.1 ABC transporter substrate-binding protein [Candidatus Limiplasma sp.]